MVQASVYSSTILPCKNSSYLLRHNIIVLVHFFTFDLLMSIHDLITINNKMCCEPVPIITWGTGEKMPRKMPVMIRPTYRSVTLLAKTTKAHEKRHGSAVTTNVMRGPMASIMNPPISEPTMDAMDGRDAVRGHRCQPVDLSTPTQQQQQQQSQHASYNHKVHGRGDGRQGDLVWGDTMTRC